MYFPFLAMKPCFIFVFFIKIINLIIKSYSFGCFLKFFICKCNIYKFGFPPACKIR